MDKYEVLQNMHRRMGAQCYSFILARVVNKFCWQFSLIYFRYARTSSPYVVYMHDLDLYNSKSDECVVCYIIWYIYIIVHYRRIAYLAYRPARSTTV